MLPLIHTPCIDRLFQFSCLHIFLLAITSAFLLQCMLMLSVFVCVYSCVHIGSYICCATLCSGLKLQNEMGGYIRYKAGVYGCSAQFYKGYLICDRIDRFFIAVL